MTAADSLLISPSLAVTTVAAAAEASARRDQLLIEADSVTTVSDRLDADSALPVLRSLNEFLTLVESHREAAKAPALKLGRDIDALAKDLVSKVKAHADRISKALGAFEAEERRKADEARRKADAEAARIAFEASKADLAARKAAPTQADAERASDQIVGQAAQKIAEVKQAAVAVAPPRPAGTQVRTDVCFEVTDIKALYAARPEMVTLEPNGTVIRAICKADPKAVIPGLRHWVESKLNVR